MIIYPAIDLKAGACVRLLRGRLEDETVYSRQPAEVALSFVQAGAEYLHIVDLDAAFSGSSQNQAAIAAIAAQIEVPFQVGGGLRTVADVRRMLAAGADRVIIGTQAAWEPDFMNRLLDEFGAEKIVLGLDAKGGAVAVAGWVQTTGQRVVDLGKQMQQTGVLRTVFTDVAKDGTLAGPNINAVKEIAAQTGLQIIASGGVTSLQDILALSRIPGVTGVIIGKALYEGKIKLAEAIEMLRVAEKELGGYAD